MSGSDPPLQGKIWEALLDVQREDEIHETAHDLVVKGKLNRLFSTCQSGKLRVVASFPSNKRPASLKAECFPNIDIGMWHRPEGRYSQILKNAKGSDGQVRQTPGDELDDGILDHIRNERSRNETDALSGM
eukprot:6620149-Prymnesium_polylepis.1